MSKHSMPMVPSNDHHSSSPAKAGDPVNGAV
jgi:hypothetical protein